MKNEKDEDDTQLFLVLPLRSGYPRYPISLQTVGVYILKSFVFSVAVGSNASLERFLEKESQMIG